MAKENNEKGLAGKILLGLAAGAVAGVLANSFFGVAPWLEWTVKNVTQVAGQMWLRALIMIVVPLVFASLTLGVAGLGDIRKVGRIGLKTVAYFLITTAIAAALGLFLVNTLRPGVGLPRETREDLLARFGGQAQQAAQQAGQTRFGIELLVNIVPRNPVAAAAQMDMLA